MIIQFEFNGLPPSANSCYPTSRSGRRFKSGKYKDFQTLFSIAAKKHKPQLPLIGNLKCEYDFYWLDKRRRDIGNLEKALSDTLTQMGFWNDDSQITVLHMERHTGNPLTVIRITEI